MKADVIHSFGDSSVLEVEDVPAPTPKDDEVLVRVLAASVNPVDYKIRAGKFPMVREKHLPMILGRDICGTVEKYGTSVTRFKRSDAVYALLEGGHGGYAELATVKEDLLATKPERLSHTEAASVPLAALTAWQGLFDHGGLESGQHVLILGGAGGVGHFAIQFAKAAGASVSTTVTKEDFEFARGLGADQVIDYHNERFEDRADKVGLVFDLIGGETQERSWAVLQDGGTIISTVSVPSQDAARERGVSAANYMAKPSGTQLEQIGRLINAGKVRPHVQATYALPEAGTALERLEQDHSRGKIVLQVGA
jgi:NADPH:quinone reductase-like Zn-dependent oxidoreductase